MATNLENRELSEGGGGSCLLQIEFFRDFKKAVMPELCIK